MSENGQEPQQVEEPEAVGAEQVEEGESQQQQKEEEEAGGEPAEQQATPEETPAQQQQEDSGAPEVVPAQQEDGEESAGGEGGEEKAAEGEGEKAEEGEGEAKQQPEGEGAKEDDEDAEPDEPQVEEEKITISHEDNPNWLSAEDCLAKGIPEESVSAFQNVYFQHAYTIKTWHAGLSDHTFQSEFITLSSDEVNVLLAASHPGPGAQPELSDEQKELLEQIETKLNEAIEKFEGDGGFIRINDRNPTDSILERNDAEFVAKVRDAVINEMEVEKQSADAYLIWRDQKHEGALRRGITRLRQSFRRQRTTSTSVPKKEGQPKLEDTTGEDGEKKEGEEATSADEQAAAAPEGGEGEKKEGEGEEGVTVTVEVEVQGAGGEQADSAPQPEAEQQTEEQPAAVEPAAEPEQQPEGEGGEEEAKKPEEGEKTEEGGGEKAEEGDGEKKEGEEIEKAPEQEEEPPKKESQHKSAEHIPIRKLKPETLDNKILRAFGRALIAMYKASSGKEALDMILRSGLTKQYLEQVKSFGEVEGLSVTISVSRYNADIARYPGMVLRGFVYEGELTALSQKHDDITYSPNVVQYKNIIQHKVKQFYTEHVKEALAERGSYIIDLFVSTEKVFILRLSPFYTGIGACLYTWNEHAKILTQGPLNFKIVEASRRAPELYSGLQSQWNSMLDSVLQQKQNEHGPPGRTCTIL